MAALALLGLGRRPDFLLGCDMQEDPEDPEDPREGGQLVCRRRRRGLAAGVCRLGSECQGSRARRLLARFRHRASRMRSSKQPRAKATHPHLLCHRRINGSTRQPPAVHVQASLTGAKLARVLQPPPPPPPPKKTAAESTISAAPQVRDKAAELKRFMPSSLRIKRQGAPGRAKPKLGAMLPKLKANPAVQRPASRPSKDDEYRAFMADLEGLV